MQKFWILGSAILKILKHTSLQCKHTKKEKRKRNVIIAIKIFRKKCQSKKPLSYKFKNLEISSFQGLTTCSQI